MYFSKDFLSELYKKLSSLYSGNDIEAQGGTQFVSELKYFLAMDYFKKQKGKPCDSNLKNDKDFFVLSVGKIVLLSDDGSFLATKNFSNSIGDARDFDVGSNFFSANAVAKSKISNEPQKFPNRHPQLLSITKGIIDIYSGGYDNLATNAEYFGGDIKKYAILFLWLNRFSSFTSKNSIYSDSLYNLQNLFSYELVSALQWSSTAVKDEVEKLISNVQLVEFKSDLKSEDFTKTLIHAEPSSSDKLDCIKIPITIDSATTRNQIKQELIEKINELEAAEKDDGFNLLSQLVLFGIQNGKIITENNISPNELAAQSKTSDNYHQHLRFGVQIYNHAKDNKLLDTLVKDKPKLQTNPSPYTHPIQKILYGVPGSGKSYTIARHLEELGITKENASEYTKRVVFHPEYTNADFIGQILPRSDASGNTISYPFVAGPFTKLLALAYTHKNQNFALIIEEINRGNAAAIFGELFQLLDRLDKDEEGSSNGYKYTSGWSSYPVTNDSINHAIFEAYMPKADDMDFAPFIPKENFEQYKENIGIRLPPNFSIFATMNTSDQNVFKLDNAFKRRFDLELIPNIFGDENGKLTAEEENQRDAEIEGFGFTWNNFRETVNEIITRPENEFDISSFSDRQIGCWFVKAEEKSEKDTDIKSELKITRKTFLNKVIEYLWDDVCNGESEIFFNPDYKTLAELINAVEKENKTDIFSKDLQEKIDSKKKTEQ